MPRVASSPKRQEIDALRTEIEGGLRGLLREHRRRLGDPDFDAAEKEEAKIKALIERLEAFEDVLDEEPPDEEFVGVFDDLIEALQAAIDDLEEKVKKIGDQELAMKTFDDSFAFPSERLLKLLHSFEDVLAGSARLLSSLEFLLYQLPAPPLLALFNFERRVRGFAKGVKSFEDVLKPLLPYSPPADTQAFLESFWKRVRELERLLASFEGLVKARKPADLGLTQSFSDLLGGGFRDATLDEILESFADLINDHHPDPKSVPEDGKLIKDYERALHRAEALIGSLAELVPDHVEKNPLLLKELQDRLRDLEERLGEFEKMVKDFAPDDRVLIVSFEYLLHILVKLLRTFHAIVRAKARKSPDRIEGFQSLLHGLEALLESFEDILVAFPRVDPDLVMSFEQLLHDLADLLEGFEGLRKGVEFPNPEGIARSNKNLNDGFQKLQASLEALKKRFDPLPEELIQSDVRVADGILTRLEVFFRRMRRPSPERAGEFMRSVTYGARTQIALCELLLRDRRRSRPVRREFQKLVSRWRRLVAAVRSGFEREARSSAFLRDALEDAAWLQSQLEQRARRL